MISHVSPVVLTVHAGDGVERLRALLEAGGFRVALHEMGGSDPEAAAGSQLIIVQGEVNPRTVSFCRRLRGQLGDTYVPILFLPCGADLTSRLDVLDAGADACLPPSYTAEELTAQARALVRVKEGTDRLAAKAAEIHHLNDRLQAAHHRLDQELELARRIQVSLLPQSLPEVPRLRFAVHYRPCGRVGGDFYDVFRLDERHVGFYIADAMGHGVPASLLTIFLKKGIQPKEINGKTYRLIPPEEVLERLNHDLIEQRLAENPFITMIYGLIDHLEGTVRFARAGHPHPMYLPAVGEPELWKIAGSLLGLFPTDFPVFTGRLGPGDKLLFCTDGIDALTFGNEAPGMPSLGACVTRHRHLPVAALIEQLVLELVHAEQTDDLTFFGLELQP
jgi:sigma-B regulation protein RsbU (phosphoserine phosphatase)